MKYEIPFSLSTPVDPIVNEWIDKIPEIYRNRQGLLDFLVRLAPRIYENGQVGNGVNPFYKIVELLDADKLYYMDLETLNEYYHFDIIRYLVQDNRAEEYVHYPCYCPDDLRKALSVRNNRTGRYALAEILSRII